MKITLYSLLFVLALAAGCSNPFREVEPTTTNPVIRARELNDSAIDMISSNINLAPAALAVFDESIALDSTYDKPVINKLGIYLQLKKYEEAKSCCARLRQMRPYDADLVVCEAMVYRMAGDNANGMEYLGIAGGMYQNSLSNLDTTAPVYHMQANKLALIYWLCGRNADAEKLAPGMTSEKMPDDAFIAAEFWKSIEPERTH